MQVTEDVIGWSLGRRSEVPSGDDPERRNQDTMHAITVTYRPRSNTKGSRLVASCERGSIEIPYPHEAASGTVEWTAARALIERFVEEDNKIPRLSPSPWLGTWIEAHQGKGRTVFVNTKGDKHHVAPKAGWADLAPEVRALIRNWLRTPSGDWPETRQAWNCANNALPNGSVPSDYTHHVPESDWHPSRRSDGECK